MLLGWDDLEVLLTLTTEDTLLHLRSAHVAVSFVANLIAAAAVAAVVAVEVATRNFSFLCTALGETIV